MSKSPFAINLAAVSLPSSVPAPADALKQRSGTRSYENVSANQTAIADDQAPLASIASELGCRELAELLTASRPAVLIDVRQFQRFTTSHIRHAVHANVSKLFFKRLQNGTMLPAELFSDAFRPSYVQARDARGVAVVYDQSAPSLESLESLRPVLAALQRDLGQVMVLRGGFDAFVAEFGNLTIGSGGAVLERKMSIEARCPQHLNAIRLIVAFTDSHHHAEHAGDADDVSAGQGGHHHDLGRHVPGQRG